MLVNGGRLAHWSRNYFPQPIKEFIRSLSAMSQDPGPWVRELRTRSAVSAALTAPQTVMVTP